MERTTVSEIARHIRVRSSTQPTVLFLGARAGGLFHNSAFYQLIELLSKNPSEFQKLGEVDKFAQCYRILAEQRESDIFGVLQQTLEKKEEHRRQHAYLAQLVKEGIFDLVISTNFDILLEDAFDSAGLKEFHSYRVYIGGMKAAHEMLQAHSGQCLVVKAFGDLKARNYKTAGNELDLNKDSDLSNYLRSVLNNHLLVVGYDPVWDDPIAAAFPEGTNDFCYINIDPPLEGSLMASIMRRRKGGYLDGEVGEYGKFMKELYKQLFTPLSTEMLDIMYFGQGSSSIERQDNKAILNSEILDKIYTRLEDNHKETLMVKKMLADLASQLNSKCPMSGE